MSCPLCSSNAPGVLLGTLGALTWLRCRGCGVDYSVPVGTLEVDEE